MPGPDLNKELIAALKLHTQTRRILIAYSGGLDSRVLLHVAAINRVILGCKLEAIHVDHGLQSLSADWAAQCVQTCTSYNIVCHVLNANLVPRVGESIEALARNKRYELFASLMHQHDLLLLAQHADDQAETVLLQLLRGAGPEGLSAMPTSRGFANGHLVRPLLRASRAELKAYATSHQLDWIEDPSNFDDRFDRNYLRKHVFPKIEVRFPGYRKTFARSASHCAELLAQSAESIKSSHQACLQRGSNTLLLSALKALDRNTQKHVLRSWIKSLGYQSPQSHQLQLMLDAFCTDNPDPSAAICTSQFQVRRYQDGLYLIKELVITNPFVRQWRDLTHPLRVPELNSELSLETIHAAGLRLDPALPVQVRSRQGGEKLRTAVGGARKSVKNLFQEHAIPPWERDKYPFIYQNDKLVAVLGLAIDPEFQTSPAQILASQSKTNTAAT